MNKTTIAVIGRDVEVFQLAILEADGVEIVSEDKEGARSLFEVSFDSPRDLFYLGTAFNRIINQ